MQKPSSGSSKRILRSGPSSGRYLATKSGSVQARLTSSQIFLRPSGPGLAARMRCASVENSSSVNAINVTLRRIYRLRDCRMGRRLFPGSGLGKRARLRKPVEHAILTPKPTAIWPKSVASRGGAVMSYHHIQVEPVSRHVGAEIGGVDLSAPIANEALAEIRDAFGQYGVVFFRDQEL